jgi:hypothetical protein
VGTARINVGINVPGMVTERSGPEGLKGRVEKERLKQISQGQSTSVKNNVIGARVVLGPGSSVRPRRFPKLEDLPCCAPVGGGVTRARHSFDWRRAGGVVKVPRLILDYDKRAWITLDCEEIEEISDSAEKIYKF